MQSKIYPEGLHRDLMEVYLARFPGGRRPIYLGVLVAVAAALVALPLLRVSVAVQAPGLVRPVMEKSDVKVPVSGRVAALLVRENQVVQQGAPLAELEPGVLNDQDGTLRYRLEQVQSFARDLRLLTRPGAPGTAGVATPKYQRELEQLRGEQDELDVRRRNAQTELQRAEELFRQSFASAAEVADRRQAVAELNASARVVAERYRSRWQAELAQAEVDRRSLESQRAEVREQRDMHRISAPVTGTIEELVSVAPGSFLQAGERLAVISPSSTLVGELYVSPRDVGLVRVGMPVRLHVGAFNYTDWGFLPGRVTEIADDFTQVDGVPVFRVRVALDRDRLHLPNGATGQVKKGMTLRAHLVVARRSLLELLRDNASDWIDPRANGSMGE